MFRIKITLIILIWSFSIVSYADDQLGFDEVCQIYTEANNSNMTVEVASKYVVDNVRRRVDSKEAIQTHEAIMHAMAGQRYTLFKESAEHVLKKSWDCNAMNTMMGMKVE